MIIVLQSLVIPESCQTKFILLGGWNNKGSIPLSESLELEIIDKDEEIYAVARKWNYFMKIIDSFTGRVCFPKNYIENDNFKYTIGDSSWSYKIIPKPERNDDFAVS